MDKNTLDPMTDSLRYAALKGFADVVRILLASGASPDARSAEGNPILWEAANKGFADVVKEFVSAGADVNACNERGVNSLMIATSLERTEVFQFLVKHHVNVNHQDSKGETALMRAAAKGNEQFVLRLLKTGADPSLRSVDGLTASDIARRKNFITVARWLEALSSNGGLGGSGVDAQPAKSGSLPQFGIIMTSGA